MYSRDPLGAAHLGSGVNSPGAGLGLGAPGWARFLRLRLQHAENTRVAAAQHIHRPEMRLKRRRRRMVMIMGGNQPSSSRSTLGA